MPLPALPVTHRWVDGGLVARIHGRAFAPPETGTTMYCWDADTDARVTDLFDTYGNPVTEIPLVQGTFRAGVPTSCSRPLFSAGPDGPRTSGIDWQPQAGAGAAIAYDTDGTPYLV